MKIEIKIKVQQHRIQHVIVGTATVFTKFQLLNALLAQNNMERSDLVLEKVTGQKPYSIGKEFIYETNVEATKKNLQQLIQKLNTLGMELLQKYMDYDKVPEGLYGVEEIANLPDRCPCYDLDA